MPQHLFYIHGFNSSPLSAKARLLGEFVAARYPDVQYHVPALPYDPERAVGILCDTIEACLPAPVKLVGSSLGGFYGTWAAERYGLPLVLVNPAVRPYELLQGHLGEQKNIYTGERYVFSEYHIEVLRGLDVDVTQPARYLLLTQTGDETLDYRQGVEKFAQCRQVVQEGGSHGFDGFETLLPSIMSFFGIEQTGQGLKQAD